MPVPLRKLLPVLVLLSALGISSFATQIPSSTAWASRSNGMATSTYSISEVSPLSVENNTYLPSHPVQPPLLNLFTTQTTSPITNSVQLAPAQSGGSPYAPWIYHTKELAITYRNGRVMLAGTPDGLGNVTADNAVRIIVTRPDNTVRTHEYVYGYPKHFGYVESTGPVNLTDMFQIGLNIVRIDLLDNLPCCWGSSAYYLVGTGIGVPPELDLPVAYSDSDHNTEQRRTDFAIAALGNYGDAPGRVNSWFDHTFPDYTSNITVTTWSHVFTDTNVANLNAYNCSTGKSCYNGHNGIDFQRTSWPRELIYPAATGVVTEVHRTYPTAGTRGATYGNYVLIDHGSGYATFYAHLESVNPNLDVGTIITSTSAITVGIMGGTGGWKPHLHFGVYFDDEGDGWSADEAFDPYGWEGESSDPWHVPSHYLWRYSLNTRQNVPTGGTTLATPSGGTSVTFPNGAVSQPTTVQLWDLPPTAGASAELRSIGRAFWLETPNNAAPQQFSKSSLAAIPFARDVTIAMSFVATDTRHLDESQLRIHWRNPSTGGWEPLPTTIDLARLQATTSHALGGRYELQAPLKCPADTLEPNDSYNTASGLASGPTTVSGLFDSVQDQDWLQLNAVAGARYTLTPAGVSTPAVQLFDRDGTTRLSIAGSDGGQLVWLAPAAGSYFIALSNQETTVNGCDASYTLSIEVTSKTFLPVVVR